MKIELVGGSLCGEIVSVKYLEPLVTMGPAGVYARRDRPWWSVGENGGIYGNGGVRMYDHIKESVHAEGG